MRYWRGRSEPDRAKSTASSTQASRKASEFDYRTAIGQDYATFHITLSLADRRYHQEEWRGHSIVHRLSTGKSVDKADGVPNAIDQ